jgi:hypothetical protein
MKRKENRFRLSLQGRLGKVDFVIVHPRLTMQIFSFEQLRLSLLGDQIQKLFSILASLALGYIFKVFLMSDEWVSLLFLH